MLRGVLAVLVTTMVVTIVFLGMKVNECTMQSLECRISNQDRTAHAARLVLQSSTTTHPLLAHEHAIQAKTTVDDIVQQFGGVAAAEKALRMKSGKLQSLRTQIYEQYQSVQQYLMEHIIRELPDLNLEINHEARLAPGAGGKLRA